MAAHQEDHKFVFRVIDALDAPHGGRILRLRLKSGEAPTVRELKGARMLALAPDGEEREVEVEGFAVFGGRPTDERLAKTGRADLRIYEAKEDPERPIGFNWELAGPLG